MVKVIPLRRWIFTAAAILVMALGCLVFMVTQTVSENALAGTKTQFSLPDQSLVTLNSNSEIDYKTWNWDSNRHLNLDGEAFFKVAKGKTFTVETALGNVTVVGTQFNVKARENRFEIECFEGKVKVETKKENQLISKGEILVFENGKMIQTSPTLAQTPAWMQNQMRIISQQLPEIIDELERIYAIDIEVSSRVSNQKFTGYLPSDNLETALEIICKTYQVEHKTGSKNTIVLFEK